MRVSFMGYGGPVYPLLLNLSNGVPFVKESYVLRGYTHFEVVCIGASGGFGGGITLVGAGVDGENSSRGPYGGGPGGGGVHRVRGLLENLPTSVPVVVGVAGADGLIITDTEEDIFTNGADGGHSRFGENLSENANLCKATGGKGGSAPTTYGFDSLWRAGNGGDGGIGAETSVDVGLGGAGGISAWSPFEPGGDPATPAVAGAWNPVTGIGQGGGGGAGGLVTWSEDGGDPPSSTIDVESVATTGGKGASHVTDKTFEAPGGSVRGVFIHPVLVNAQVGAGAGGGAKATILNSLLTAYGTKANGLPGHGLVLIRLTKV